MGYPTNYPIPPPPPPLYFPLPNLTQALAQDAAAQGLVLLKNDKNALPLTPGKTKLAVVGPHTKATNTMLGNYYGTDN